MLIQKYAVVPAAKGSNADKFRMMACNSGTTTDLTDSAMPQKKNIKYMRVELNSNVYMSRVTYRNLRHKQITSSYRKERFGEKGEKHQTPNLPLSRTTVF